MKVGTDEESLLAGSVAGEAKPHADYADDPPRELSDDYLQFLADYTGQRDLAALRQHVLKVWTEVKAKVHRTRQGTRCSGLEGAQYAELVLAKGAAHVAVIGPRYSPQSLCQ